MFRSELVLAIHTAQLIRLVIRKVVYDSSSNIFYGGTWYKGRRQYAKTSRRKELTGPQFQVPNTFFGKHLTVGSQLDVFTIQ